MILPVCDHLLIYRERPVENDHRHLCRNCQTGLQSLFRKAHCGFWSGNFCRKHMGFQAPSGKNVRGTQNGILTAGMQPGSRFMILFFCPKSIMAPSGAAYPWNPGRGRRTSGSMRPLCRDRTGEKLRLRYRHSQAYHSDRRTG